MTTDKQVPAHMVNLVNRSAYDHEIEGVNITMKTLGKGITKAFYNDRESGYDQIKAAWKAALDSGVPLTCEHHVMYAILRGKDYRKGLTPVTSDASHPRRAKGDHKGKLSNGGYFNWGGKRAVEGILASGPSDEAHLLAVFGGTVKPEVFNIIRAILPNPKWPDRLNPVPELGEYDLSSLHVPGEEVAA